MHVDVWPNQYNIVKSKKIIIIKKEREREREKREIRKMILLLP